MSLESFRARITYNSTDYDLAFVFSDVVLSDKLDQELNIIRRTLDTKLVFKGSAYDQIKTISDALGDCGELPCQIRKGDSLSTLVFEATIKLGSNKVEWDEDACIVTIGLDSKDDYAPFFDKWEDEFNIFDGTTTRTITCNPGTNREQTCSESGTISGGFPEPAIELQSSCLETPTSWGPLVFEIQVDVPGDAWDRDTEWIRNELASVPTNSGDWVNVSGETPSVANFARPVFSKGYLNNDSRQDFETIDTIPDGVLLNDIITTFLPSGFTVRSEFFKINETGTGIPQNDAYNLADTRCEYIMVVPKNSVKNYSQSNAATAEYTTFKKLLAMLKVQFNVEFRITGTLVEIEHVSFFRQNTNGIDITAIENEKYTKGNNKYTFDSSKVARKEEWKFAEEVSSDFTEQPYFYPCATSDDNDENIFIAENVNNDIKYIVSNPDKVADEGFSFICCAFDSPDYILTFDFNSDQTKLLANHFLSFPSLISTFHIYERPFASANKGAIDGTTVNFLSQIRRKAQREVEFKMTEEDYLTVFNPEDLVRTGIGWGAITEASYSFRDGKLKVKTNHA